ncbi:MAG TPA: helix-turn-helix domain-containing protein [Longimicrobiaceae bacterium]
MAKAEVGRTDDSGTERRILDAARRVFMRRGTAGARMQEIAEEAGVNQALLHYYFRSKERLAEAVFLEVAKRLVPAVAEILGSAAPLEQKVRRAVEIYIDTVRKTPYLPAYVLSELHHHPERFQALVANAAGGRGRDPHEVLELLRRQLDEEAAAGRLRPIAPEQFLLNVMGLVAAPFLVLPILPFVLPGEPDAFDRILDERRAELPDLILRSLRP